MQKTKENQKCNNLACFLSVIFAYQASSTHKLVEKNIFSLSLEGNQLKSYTEKI